MQRSLLPRGLPEVDGLDVGAVYESSARVEVGGDVYDFLTLPDGLAVVLGCERPRGRRLGRHGACEVRLPLARPALSGPGRALTQANEVAIGELAGGTFVTMVCVTVDPATGDVCAASAGHPPLRVLSPDGAVTALAPSGLALGIEADQHYEQDSANLSPGAALCLYTDGLIEVRRDGVQYGVDRLDAALAAGCELSAQNLEARRRRRAPVRRRARRRLRRRRHPPDVVARSVTAEEPGLRRAGAHSSLNVLVFFAGAGALATGDRRRQIARALLRARRSSGRTSSASSSPPLRRLLAGRKGGGPQPEPAMSSAASWSPRDADRDRPLRGRAVPRRLGEGSRPDLRRRSDRFLLRRARAVRAAGDPARHGRAVRSEARHRGRPGRRLRRRRLYALSTAGSLLGTFLSALVLIPAIGTRRTLLVAAVTVALSGAVLLGRRWLVVAAALGALDRHSAGRGSRRAGPDPRAGVPLPVHPRHRAGRGAPSISTRESPSTRSGGAARCSRAASGTPISPHPRSSAGPFAPSPFSATQAGRRRGRSASSIRRHGSTASSSTGRSVQSAAASSASTTIRASTWSPPTRARSSGAPEAVRPHPRRCLPAALRALLPGDEGVLPSWPVRASLGRRDSPQRRRCAGDHRLADAVSGTLASEFPQVLTWQASVSTSS